MELDTLKLKFKEVDGKVLKFQHSFSMVVSGPSKAGKSVFVSKFVKFAHSLMETPPAEILWCYSEYQPAYRELAASVPNLRLIEGVPDIAALKRDTSRHKLVIFDDLMDRFKKDQTLVTLFIKGCHHWNLSCIHIVQNLYFEGLRTVRINSNYLVLFKNPSDQLQISTLGRQMYPRQTEHFLHAFKDATAQPFTYLLVDTTQQCPNDLRLRTNIFPGEVQIVYLVP